MHVAKADIFGGLTLVRRSALGRLTSPNVEEVLLRHIPRYLLKAFVSKRFQNSLCLEFQYLQRVKRLLF